MTSRLITLSLAEVPFKAKGSHLSIDLLVHRFCYSSNKHSLNPSSVLDLGPWTQR